MDIPEQISVLLGLELKGAIHAHGKTVGEIAEAVGIERSTLSRYLNGKREIPATTFILASRAIGVAPAVLMNRAMARVRQPIDIDRGLVDWANDYDLQVEEDAAELDIKTAEQLPRRERDR